MAIHARLSSHVFPSFDAFKAWLITQSFDIMVNPNRGPILKAGQKITITDSKIEYLVCKDVTNLEDILENSSSGDYASAFKQQDFIFRLFTPATPRVELFSDQNPGSIEFNLGDILITQNSNININFSKNPEEFYKISQLTVASNGNVKINTKNFTVDCILGNTTERYPTNNSFFLNSGSTYLFTIKSETMVFMVEIGKTLVTYDQDIPENPYQASQITPPSTQAVAKSIAQIKTRINEAIEGSGGFLSYWSINPITDKVEKYKKDTYLFDPLYIKNNESELPKPTRENQFSLTLNNHNTIEVFKSKTIMEPILLPNPLYLGSGHYGTIDVSDTLIDLFPTSPTGGIVGNLDDGYEWIYNGLSWQPTIKPIGDSNYSHNTDYLGVYDFLKDTNLQILAIDMVFPLVKQDSIVLNETTKTEWKKGRMGWYNTNKPLGTTPATVPNPIVSGTFQWDPTNNIQVNAALNTSYKDAISTGSIVDVNNEEWMYDENTNTWTNTGIPKGTNDKITNPQYIIEGPYGSSEFVSGILANQFPDSIEGDIIGNTDTNTEWEFKEGEWVNTRRPVGTSTMITNPSYHGEFVFKKTHNSIMLAIISALYPEVQPKSIIYNLETGIEWEKQDNEQEPWINTYRNNYSTAERLPNQILVGSFSYKDNWTSPARTMQLLFPNAKPKQFVCNVSTGTEWEFSREKTSWIDTKRPIGSSAIKDNPNYFGTDKFKTNPPIDDFIIQRAFPEPSENQFIYNRTTDTFWQYLLGTWINTGKKELNRFIYKQNGEYGWEDRGPSDIVAGAMFHITSLGNKAGNNEIYWVANTWNILDFETITIPQFSNNNTGTITGINSWGHIEAVQGNNGVSYGKIVGITNEGRGDKFLSDNGTYQYPQNIVPINKNIDLYIDLENGDDNNSGTVQTKPWKTTSRLTQFYAFNKPTYDLSDTIPQRVTIHLLGNAPGEDFVIDSIPYLVLVGPKGTSLSSHQCRRLHIVNSTVILGNNITCRERIVCWRAKVYTRDKVSCYGLKLINSLFEQSKDSELIFCEIEDTKSSVIHIDEDSTLYHSGTITTKANLHSYVPFINILGRYVKGGNGKFYSTDPMRLGSKFSVGPTAELIGVNVKWLDDNIPYEFKCSVDTNFPVVTPSIQTLYGTKDKTGFKIGDGTDLSDVIKGILQQTNATFNSLSEVYNFPKEKRYIGMLFYIVQSGNFYFFRGGIENGNIQELVVPAHNVAYSIKDSGMYDWLNKFPFENIDAEGFIHPEPQVIQSECPYGYGTASGNREITNVQK